MIFLPIYLIKFSIVWEKQSLVEFGEGIAFCFQVINDRQQLGRYWFLSFSIPFASSPGSWGCERGFLYRPPDWLDPKKNFWCELDIKPILNVLYLMPGVTVDIGILLGIWVSAIPRKRGKYSFLSHISFQTGTTQWQTACRWPRLGACCPSVVEDSISIRQADSDGVSKSKISACSEFGWAMLHGQTKIMHDTPKNKQMFLVLFDEDCLCGGAMLWSDHHITRAVIIRSLKKVQYK